MTDTAVNEALVVRIQTLFRARRARREAVELANSAYLKCWDSVTGFAYYCNLRTGLASWKKPLLLAGRDRVEIPVNDTNPLQDEVETNSEPVVDDSQTRLSLKERQQRRDESLVFQQKCATEKQELMIQHRRKVARAMRRFEKRMMDEKRRARVERQEKLKNDNQQLLQELYEGKKKENVETIREAAMRGHVDRIENLLDMGFSADAESAMGLTPLLASCQSGHLDVVKKLLARGANVNHAHIKTARTALMEAASRANPSVLKELLRYGARIHVEDAQGETVFDCMKDAANREIVEDACRTWSMENAALFPTEFRQVSLAFALIQTRQREAYEAKKISTRRDLTQRKLELQRKCAEAKVSYDQCINSCKLEATLMRRLIALDVADSRYDDERRTLLLEAQGAIDQLRDSERPCFIPEAAVLNILSFCARHWFEIDPRQAQLTRKKKRPAKKRGCDKLKGIGALNPVPIALRSPPDQLPQELESEWSLLQQNLKRLCEQLQAAESNEHFDTACCVSKDASGASLATLDICVEQAENLPFRDPRIGDMVDPFVRVFLRSSIKKNGADLIESDARIGDRNPVWSFQCQITAVPSIQHELSVQVMDAKRQDVAGETSIPLRSLLDQKDHDDWHIMPPTLRQQLLEKHPREQSARIRICVRFTHTKSIVITRELQQLMKTREVIIKKRREVIQDRLQQRLQQLP